MSGKLAFEESWQKKVWRIPSIFQVCQTKVMPNFRRLQNTESLTRLNITILQLQNMLHSFIRAFM